MRWFASVIGKTVEGLGYGKWRACEHAHLQVLAGVLNQGQDDGDGETHDQK